MFGAGEQSERVRAHKGTVKNRNCSRELNLVKFEVLYRLKTLTWPTSNACFPLVTAYTHANACFPLVTAYTHAMIVFHWSRLTPTQCLFSTGHGLHPRNACFPLVTAYTHAMLVFHWSRLTSTQCLFSTGHGLHPRNACFSLAIAYPHTMLILHWSQLNPTHSLFPVIILLILSTAARIWQQHPLGSSRGKVLYNTWMFFNGSKRINLDCLCLPIFMSQRRRRTNY